jgi:hypothetical protein
MAKDVELFVPPRSGKELCSYSEALLDDFWHLAGFTGSGLKSREALRQRRLITLMSKFRHKHCAFPRDRTFSLLSLCDCGPSLYLCAIRAVFTILDVQAHTTSGSLGLRAIYSPDRSEHSSLVSTSMEKTPFTECSLPVNLARRPLSVLVQPGGIHH